MMMMMVGGGGGVLLDNGAIDVTAEGQAPQIVTCTVSISPNGEYAYGGSDIIGPTNWYSPTTLGIGNSFKAMLQKTSGQDVSGMAYGTYYTLNSQLTIQLSRSSIGSSTFIGVLNICDLNNAVISSIQVTMRVIRTASG